MDDAIAALEQLVARDVGRGSERLAAHTTGSLRRAADSLLDASRLDVAILTGFYVPRATPPAAETDGPIGAVQLAAAIRALGGRACLVTDALCAPVVQAAIDAAAVDAEIAEPSDETTHFIAVERVGPSWGDGPPRNMRGEDVSEWTEPLDRMYSKGSWTKIAIGDGGNEVGMGSLPHDVVSSVVVKGDLIHCPVACDVLIVAGTSNWGAAGLVGALAIARPGHAELRALLDPDWSDSILDAIVREAGAVDGLLREPMSRVDGLAPEAYRAVLEEVQRISLEVVSRRLE
jgi:hypothetical protein